MDPPTILAVVNLQIQDIEDLLANPTTTADERATFESMRIGLLSELAEINDRAAAFQLLVEENANHRTFQRLTNEEVQTQDDHSIALRLEGRPVSDPPPLAAIDPAHITPPRKSPTPATPVHHILTPDATASPAPTQNNPVELAPTPEPHASQEPAAEPSADIGDSTDFRNSGIEDDQTIPSVEQPAQERPTQDTEERAVESTGTQNEPPNTPETSGPTESPVDTDSTFEPKDTAPIAIAHEPAPSREKSPPLSVIQELMRSLLIPESEIEAATMSTETTAVELEEHPFKAGSPLRPEKDKSAEVDLFPQLETQVPTATALESRQTVPEVVEELFENQLTMKPKIQDGASTVKASGESDSSVLTTDEPTGTPSHLQATCVSCFENFANSEVSQLPCKNGSETECHAYCRECLIGIFEASLSDPSLFPPRCCSEPIPLSTTLFFLPQEIHERFLSRLEELDTPDKTYCSDPACAQWIRPTSIEAGIATCRECQKRTCAFCKEEQHEDLCPEDEDVKKLMRFVRKRKWQTCPSCKNVVELSLGCYHIT
jgi:hypothetical protein